MKDSTPYRERPQGQIEREAECMRVIFAHATPVDFIFEAFGGLGTTAAIMLECFPQTRIQAAELDQKCTETYNQTFPNMQANCSQMDALSLLQKIGKLPPRWGASLDFNRFTLMDVRGRREGLWKTGLIEAVIERKPAWIQVTDSAIRYLHFHHKRYGCKLNPDDYIRKLSAAMKKRWGLTYVTHSNYYAASYLLLTPAH